jgi:hypothetical protein
MVIVAVVAASHRSAGGGEKTQADAGFTCLSDVGAFCDAVASLSKALHDPILRSDRRNAASSRNMVAAADLSDRVREPFDSTPATGSAAKARCARRHPNDAPSRYRGSLHGT